MDLKTASGGYKRIACPIIALCGAVGTVLMLISPTDLAGPYRLAMALVLAVFGAALPVALMLRKLGILPSLVVFVLAMLTNATVLGVKNLAVGSSIFAIVAAAAAGVGAIVFTLLWAEQSSVENKNRF